MRGRMARPGPAQTLREAMDDDVREAGGGRREGGTLLRVALVALAPR